MEFLKDVSVENVHTLFADSPITKWIKILYWYMRHVVTMYPSKSFKKLIKKTGFNQPETIVKKLKKRNS